MSCKSKESLVQAAVCSLIKEIIAAYEARRRARRQSVEGTAAPAATVGAL